MMTEVVAVTASGVFVVNGPKDDPDSGGIYLRWRDAEDNVARLGQRIFKATQAADFTRVRSL
jgi:RNA-directed DNA polymerase